ncbi:MAG: carboxymuconolactone decarboxylase family protein [Sphingobium sp.]
MSILSQEERVAAEARVREVLGVAMMGSYSAVDGRPGSVGSQALDKVESEILGLQLYAYGEVWSRPGLDLRTRCFITLAAIGARAQSRQLAKYVHAALNLDISPEDILEALIQMGAYAGLSTACEGFDVARDVFVARGLRHAGAGADTQPSPPMTREDRTAAFQRVARDLGIGRLGVEEGAPPLQMLKNGPWATRAIDLPLEREEINVIQAEYGYGEVWGRPALGYRIRSFVTVATLQALVQNDQLHFHLNNALNLGITPHELHEAMLQVGVYHGGSGYRNAANVARDVFLQRGIVQPA